MNSLNLSREEQVIGLLRTLYEQYGYSQFKMSKFEEYDLYVRNKDFLISDGIITFTDTNGKLLALKPDVTLSIIKNFRGAAGLVDKVYYDENVYRVSSGTNSFKEIKQVGVECMGEVDSYSLFEILTLAAKSLRILSDQAVLDISNFGILMDLIDSFGLDSCAKKEILRAISEKNPHDLAAICEKEGVCEKNQSILSKLISIYGAPKAVLPEIRALLMDVISEKKLNEFEALCLGLCEGGFSDMVRIDFSVVNGLDYYNNVVFRGFIKGVPTWVLSGGQYDRLMQKMDRNARAVGFAVYLDLMEDMFFTRKNYDVDSVVLYSENVPFSEVDLVLSKLISEGKSVMAQKNIPTKLAYKELWKLTESGVELLERNA